MKLAFHKGSAIFSRAIEYGTHSPYSHAELLFSDGLSFSARAERTPAVDIIAPEFDRAWDFVTIPERYDEPAVRQWCEAQRGKGYDWAEDIAFVLPFIKEDSNKLMCSGCCTAALQRAGLFKSFTPSK